MDEQDIQELRESLRSLDEPTTSKQRHALYVLGYDRRLVKRMTKQQACKAIQQAIQVTKDYFANRNQ